MVSRRPWPRPRQFPPIQRRGVSRCRAVGSLRVESDQAVQHVEGGVLKALTHRRSPNPQPVESFAHCAIDLGGDHRGRSCAWLLK
jgi:hypothetical protein